MLLILALILAPRVVWVQRVVHPPIYEPVPVAGVKPLQRPSSYG